MDNTVVSTNFIEKVMAAIQERGIQVELVNTGAEALQRLQALIPAGADIMTGVSVTLTQIGLDDLLISGNHPWNNLKNAILAEKDLAKQLPLRMQATQAEYFLGSPQAITENGQLVFVSAGGSQLPAFAFTSKHVIWVAGIQKIVPNLDAAFERIREICLPAEDARAKSVGMRGSFIGKTLIFDREGPMLRRELRLIIVNETLGV